MDENELPLGLVVGGSAVWTDKSRKKCLGDGAKGQYNEELPFSGGPKLKGSRVSIPVSLLLGVTLMKIIFH